jgi:hypothetical protein
MSESSKTEHEKAIERIMAPPPRPTTEGKKRRWSKDEDNLLKELYPKNNVKYIANKIDRSVTAIHRHACIIGITNKCVLWSSQEEKLLKKLWSKKSYSDIAKIIGRSVSAITLKAHKLGLSSRNK